MVAAGMSEMAQNFGSASTQGAILISVGNQAAGSSVTLFDKTSGELISWAPAKSYDCVLISCPGITDGSEYTVKADSYSSSITINGLIYGSGFSGVGGNRPGGNMPGGDSPDGTPPAGGRPGDHGGR